MEPDRRRRVRRRRRSCPAPCRRCATRARARGSRTHRRSTCCAATTGGGASRTAQQLQSAIDAAAAAGGGTVALQPGEVVRVGATSNQQLVVKPGVTLTTTGAPTPSRYARMGRLVGRRSRRRRVRRVRLLEHRDRRGGDRAASLRNVWVDGAGDEPGRTRRWRTSRPGAAPPPGRPRVLDNRVTNPGRAGAGIRGTRLLVVRGGLRRRDDPGQPRDRVRGTRMGSTGCWSRRASTASSCTAKRRSSRRTRSSTPRTPGSCCTARTTGSSTRPGPSARASPSNTVVSAGLGAHVAIGVDPTGECAGHVDPRLVPCIDVPTTRSFDGAVVRDNRFWTGPRTAFEIGLMVGSAPLWGDHRVPGVGRLVHRQLDRRHRRPREHRGLDTGHGRARTVSGNASSFTLVDVRPGPAVGQVPGRRARRRRPPTGA